MAQARSGRLRSFSSAVADSAVCPALSLALRGVRAWAAQFHRAGEAGGDDAGGGPAEQMLRLRLRIRALLAEVSIAQVCTQPL